MSRRHQPEYRSGSVGGGLVALVLILAVVLLLDDKPAPPAPEAPDINIAIDVPPAPTTTTAPTTSVDLSRSKASGTLEHPKQDEGGGGVAGAKGIEQRARHWAQQFALDCIIDKLTGRGLCLP